MSKAINQNNHSIVQSPEVCVVEASAGSGKTFALAKRYVQLLLTSPGQTAALRTILAITFTNKASLEMKARILEFLKKIALKHLSVIEHQEIVKPLGISDDEASARAHTVMDNLIRNFNFFQVQTIDSFINALLSGCSFKINLSANFKIKRNSRDYVAQSLDRLIDRAVEHKDIRQVLNHFVHQYLFIENRTGWFPKKDLLNLMSTLFVQGHSFAKDFMPVDVGSDDLFIKKKNILRDMRDLKDILPENTHATFRKNFLQFLIEHPESFDIDSISDYFEREDFPSTQGKPVSSPVERLWKTIHRELKDLCEMEALTIFNPYIQIFDLMMSELRILAVKEDVLFLEQLNKKARSLFDDGLVTVEELYYRLATRFHHYMIDEFQDTSRLQWGNLSMMVEEGLSTGGSLFYVGDKKQAIYSFRGGDSRLFDEIKAGFSAFNVREETLRHNYRSRRNIVEFNNKIFSQENLDRFILLKEENDRERSKKKAVCFDAEDLLQLRHVFANTQQVARDGFEGGLVHIQYIDGAKKEERDVLSRQKLIALAGELRQRFSLRDIAILTRNNNEVETITGWFLEAGIPVESDRTSNIQANTVIQDLTAFLKFLDSPIDNVSFAHFILGDVFLRASGLKSEELNQFLFELRQKTSKDKAFYIYKKFRDRYHELWEKFFDEFFKSVGLYPLYELVVNMIDRLEIPLNFPNDQGFVMHFLEVIKRQEKEHGDLTSFLDYFEDPLPEDLYVNVTDHDSIRILTIHKAKGLEFPVVILPSLEIEIKVGSGGRDGQQSFIVHHVEEGIHLLRLKDKYRHFSNRLRGLYQAEYKRAFLSELNNVYVALTRAVHELHIFIPSKAGNSSNVAQFLIPDECWMVGEPVVIKKNAVTLEGRLRLPFAAHKNWIGFLKEEFLNNPAGQRNVRLRGEAMHFLLSLVGNLNKSDLEAVLLTAAREGKTAYPMIKDFDQIHREWQITIKAPSLKDIFHVGDACVLCELEVIDAFGAAKRIDRLIVRETSIDIIDYKSSREDYEHQRQQVKDYVQLMAPLYPHHQMKGWLVYLNDYSLEQVT